MKCNLIRVLCVTNYAFSKNLYNNQFVVCYKCYQFGCMCKFLCLIKIYTSCTMCFSTYLNHSMNIHFLHLLSISIIDRFCCLMKLLTCFFHRTLRFAGFDRHAFYRLYGISWFCFLFQLFHSFRDFGSLFI